MTTTLTGSDSYSNTATAPADGDTRNVASVNTPLQALLNNTRNLYLHGRIKDLQFSTSSVSLTASSATFANCTNGTLTFSSCSAGDVIFVWASYYAANQSGTVSTRLVIVDGATTDTSPATRDNVTQYVSNGMARTIVTGGTVTASLQMHGDGTNNSAVTSGQIFGVRFSQV